ncbi:MAG: ComEC/Rec2 family competence protein [Novosphingobium sp.]
MVSDAALPGLDDAAPQDGAALQHDHWRRRGGLSSGLDAWAGRVEHFLDKAGFDRAPWLAVFFAAGIGLWFGLDNLWQWLGLIAGCLGRALMAWGLMQGDGRYPHFRVAVAASLVTIAAGCLTVWAKSTIAGVPAIERPQIVELTGVVLDREEQPAMDRVRLVLAARDPASGRAMRMRINVGPEYDRPDAAEGALVRVRARLMPPAPPMVPGSYDFARAAWFAGIGATGSALGPVDVAGSGQPAGMLSRLQRHLSQHIHSEIPGSAGGIAAAFASGDRGGISAADEQAMRDSGLTHLLSVSGLHVSAVIAGGYFLALRLLALWPWLTLRVRLPIVAAGAGALTGVGYTLLTGAQMPTVRACAGAILVMLALVLGREALSLRLLAVAAMVVMLIWPESVVGPSFQMSFASVLAILSLHTSAPVRGFLAHREESWFRRSARGLAMLLVTGLVIELALMPIAFFHFHRAGIFGALANVIAIPLTTFVSMPLIAIALFLDIAGMGGSAWWLAGKSLELLLAIAHWVAAQPGAVNHLPAIGATPFILFAAGALWLALWRGRVRLWGLAPAGIAALGMAVARPPDVLISGDGRNVGIVGETGGKLLVLREGRSDYARENLSEVAGMSGEVVSFDQWPGARCNEDFCSIVLDRGGRTWRLLLSRGHVDVPERALAAACASSEVVVADRWLPRSCRPTMRRADRALLDRTGGLALDLASRRVTTVARSQGQHGWWRASAGTFRPRPNTVPAAGESGQTAAPSANPAGRASARAVPDQ